MFQQVNQLTDPLCEVEQVKPEFTAGKKILVGFFILQSIKLKVLEAN